MEEDKRSVVNHFEAGSNCQVFNGNITGCVFAMPGSNVTQQAAQPTDSSGAENRACTNEPTVADVQEKREPKKLTDTQRQLLTQLEALIAKGDWREPASVESIGRMMRTVLNVGDVALTSEEVALSERLWSLLETRRGGDALRVTWQNLVGYFDEQQFFHPHIQGSPSLSKLFFGNADGYTNIDKGRPGKSGMLNDFKAVLPLLDKYRPRKI